MPPELSALSKPRYKKMREAIDNAISNLSITKRNLNERIESLAQLNCQNRDARLFMLFVLERTDLNKIVLQMKC